MIEGKEDLAKALAENSALQQTIAEQDAKIKAVSKELVQAEMQVELTAAYWMRRVEKLKRNRKNC